jgi:3-oxoacyl-[acyl-carrier-protein] synthase III
MYIYAQCATGCPRGTVAFDLTAACSGFLFATVTASQFLTTGTYKKALVLGADALSRWVDWEDRNTCILFGDGAGAVVLEVLYAAVITLHSIKCAAVHSVVAACIARTVTMYALQYHQSLLGKRSYCMQLYVRVTL